MFVLCQIDSNLNASYQVDDVFTQKQIVFWVASEILGGS